MDGLSVLIILCITAIIVAVFNITCIYVIRKSKKLMRKPSTGLILNLLITHLLQAFLVMPFYALKRNLSRSSIICTGFRYFYFLTFYITIYNVLLISLDRFLAIRLKVTYSITVTNRRVCHALSCVWLYVVAVTMIPFDYPTKCPYTPQKQWVLFMLLGNGAFPFIVVVLLYVYIVMKLRYFSFKLHSKGRLQRYTISNTTTDTNSATTDTYMNSVIITTEQRHLHVTKTSSTNNTHNICSDVISNSSLSEINISDSPATSRNIANVIRARKLRRSARANNRITKNTLIVIATYALAWMPSIVYFTLKTLNPAAFHPDFKDSSAEEYVDFFLKYIKFIEGIASPLLYCYLNGYFKSVMKQMCCTPGVTLDRMTSITQSQCYQRKQTQT